MKFEPIEWRQIPGFAAYEVSECGVIRRRLRGKTRRLGHIPRGGIASKYVVFKLMNDAGGKTCLGVHRLVLLAFVGPRPTPTHEVAHWNDVQHENDRWNLRYATLRENRDDTIRLRTFAGARNGRAKLTPEQVRQARAMYTGKHGEQSQIARQFGLSSQAMRSVLVGDHWKHV